MAIHVCPESPDPAAIAGPEGNRAGLAPVPRNDREGKHQSGQRQAARQEESTHPRFDDGPRSEIPPARFLHASSTQERGSGGGRCHNRVEIEG
ncbi:MAG: hypothetical protein L6Q84_35545, partial [Polyangiaceae bacterium]|nr:hypothetical protein [Polyangiaceae bacterium]